MISLGLKRSILDRIFGGVCGGIGNYLGISGWWVRLAYVLIIFTNWQFGLLLYLLLWMAIPPQRATDLPPVLLPDEIAPPRYTRAEGLLALGALTIIIGVILLADRTGILHTANGDLLPPLMLLLIGLVALLKHLRGVA